LPVHDAFYFEVPNESVNEMKTVIELCMSTMNPIPKTNGRRLGVDITVYPSRLGEKVKA
jgi:DNA polymerase I-like protein with 3'-5' exonuclease and polymerase domains